MARHIIVGIDIGTFTTRVVVSEYPKGEQEPTIIGTGTSESRGLRHGYITNTNEAVKSIRKAVKEAEKSSGVSIKQVYISIGGISVSSEIALGTAIISKADNEVTSLDIEKAIKESEDQLVLNNKRTIYFAPIMFKIDGKEVLGRPEGMHGIKLEVKTLFITCLTQHLDDLEEACVKADLEVLDIFPSSFAAGAVALTPRQKTVGCALVNIGAETVTLSVFENGGMIGMHVFSIGSTDITNDIALGLKIPLEEAEGIKIGSMLGNYPKKKLDEIIEARLGDIFELIETYLKKMRRNELLPAGVIITGGGSALPVIEELSKTLLKLPTRIGTGEMITVGKGKLRDSTWFVAYGLTLLAKENRQMMHVGSFGEILKKTKLFFRKLFGEFRP